MNLDDSPAQAEYRARFRDWLGSHAQGAPKRTVLAPPTSEEVRAWRAWQAQLADAGFAAPAWPVEHGGGGHGPSEQAIVSQELERRRVAGVFDYIGIDMVGPTLMARATPAQCERYLAPLLRGDEPWCQLFSEPGAGSDLAAISTRARRQADGTWKVDGQKVWTTHAQHATFGIMLARTDTEVAKHRGLTMFVVPMDAAGLTIVPLRQITGDAEFNEVFLDGVELSADSVVGNPGEGWSVAMTMLGFERLSVGSGTHTASLDRLVDVIAQDHKASTDPTRLASLGNVATQLLAVKYHNYRLLTEIEKGKLPGPETGIVKISSLHGSLAACRLAVDVLGPGGLTDGEWGHQVSALPALRSAGGTEEIIRNILGERVLGLPPEPKVASNVGGTA